MSYATTFLHLGRTTIIWMILAAAVVWLVVAARASISDRLGRRRVLLSCLAPCPVVAGVLPVARHPIHAVGAPGVRGVLGAVGAANGPQAALFAELFHTQVRYSGISLPTSWARSSAGGIAPFWPPRCTGSTRRLPITGLPDAHLRAQLRLRPWPSARPAGET